MFRCMPTTIEKTLPSSRKDSNVFEPQKIAALQNAISMDNAQHIFIVVDQTAISRLRTKQTWVRTAEEI